MRVKVQKWATAFWAASVLWAALALGVQSVWLGLLAALCLGVAIGLTAGGK